MTASNEWLKDTALADLYHRDPRSLTDAELERIENVHDRELMRASGSMHYLPSLEAMRRLRETIASEERAIKRLTVVLVILTLVLVGFALVDWRAKHRVGDAPATVQPPLPLRTAPAMPAQPSAPTAAPARK